MAIYAPITQILCVIHVFGVWNYRILSKIYGYSTMLIGINLVPNASYISSRALIGSRQVLSHPMPNLITKPGPRLGHGAPL